MPFQYSNNASSSLASGITSTATSLTVTTGQGVLFPAPSGSNAFNATLIDASGNLEIVRVTARSGDMLTITRGQESTTARAFTAGSTIQLRLTAAGLQNFAQVDAATTFLSTVTVNDNLVVGASPGAWEVGSGLQTGNGAGVSFGYTRRGVSQNLYYDGTNYRRQYTGEAALYQFGGTHIWYNAASGTAGAIASLTQSMALDASGNLTATGNVTAFSDERLKTDWQPLIEGFLGRLAGVKHGSYVRTDTGERQVGVSAQSLREVMPEAVMEGEHLSVAYGNAALTACVELAKEAVALRAELDALKAKLIGD
jgi:hypothetical protein